MAQRKRARVRGPGLLSTWRGPVAATSAMSDDPAYGYPFQPAFSSTGAERAASRAARMAKEVGSVDEEHVLTARGDETGTNTMVALINTVQTGTGIQNRTRNDIQCVSIGVRGQIFLETVATNRKYHIYVVYDKRPGSSLPNWNDIFQGIDGAGGTVNDADAYLNPNNNRRFFVIMHDQGYLHTTGGATDVNMTKNIEMFRKCGYKISYSATNNPITVSDIAIGAIYLLVMCDKGTTAGTNGVTLNCVTRLRFIG